MALTISSSSSSFLARPLKTVSFTSSRSTSLATRRPASLTINASSSSPSRPSTLPPMKIVRCPALDRRAVKHSKLRFVRKLKTLLLSKSKHFIPLRILSRCRAYLNPPPSRSLLSMIHRYPAIFRLFHARSHTSPSLSLLAVTLTPAAAAIAADESRLRSEIAGSLAAKLQRLLMLSPHRRILLSKLVHFGPDLGLAPDFRSRLCNDHPSRFRTVDTSYGRALELVRWDTSLAAPIPPFRRAGEDDPLRRPIIDRPPRFKQLQLRRGLNLRRRHRDYLIRFNELPDVNPYGCARGARGEAPAAEAEEKRACAVVRELLGMTTEKRTLVDHLTHFRKDFGLPNRLRAMLVRHPEMFYVSISGARHSVFLVEAYDEKGRLVVEDEHLSAKERLAELVREGKRMRRERRRSVGFGDEEEEEEVEEEEEEEEEEGDLLDDLFEVGIGDDWESWEEEGEVGGGEEAEIGEIWVKRAVGGERDGGGGRELEAW